MTLTGYGSAKGIRSPMRELAQIIKKGKPRITQPFYQRSLRSREGISKLDTGVNYHFQYFKKGCLGGALRSKDTQNNMRKPGDECRYQPDKDENYITATLDIKKIKEAPYVTLC